MFPVVLSEEQYINPETEAHYAFYQDIANVTTRKHSHEFFELVLVLKGSIGHIVGADHTVLAAGSLTLVRPQDAHCFQQLGRAGCQLINLAFSARSMYALLDYLGTGFQPERLLDARLPPTVMLTAHLKDNLRGQIEKLNSLPLDRADQVRTGLRLLLLDILARHFGPDGQPEPAWPPWMVKLVKEMQLTENFVPGLGRMQRLAAVSPEHLARTFRRYLDKTPTEFVNELRLNYAANLLAHSDLPILQVASAAGFESLSHFYRLFAVRFGESPARFRAGRHRSLIGSE